MQRLHRVEVAMKECFPEPRGEKILRFIKHDKNLSISSIRVVEVYTIKGEVDEQVIKKIAPEVFGDPVIQEVFINTTKIEKCDWIAEISYRPGVTDNVGRTATESINLVLKSFLQNEKKIPQLQVAYSIQYRISADGLNRKQIEKLAENYLYNPLIHRCDIISKDEVENTGGVKPYFPEVTETFKPHIEYYNLEEMDDQQLIALSQKRLLALSLEEMKAIRNYFLREDVREIRKKDGLLPHPTDVELECIAQTWSEHCKHKIFNATIEYTDVENHSSETIKSLFKSFIVTATQQVRSELGSEDYCLSVFKDNAGVIKFDEENVIAFKVETHNSPSALDPYGGALTGIVGVNRDPLGTGVGMRLFCNTDVFCLGYPDYRKELPPRVLHPMRILEGVREGVEHGGNKSGIPTVNGAVVFDERFTYRPVVYCGTGGIAPMKIGHRFSYEKCAQPGDYIVMVGGKIGKDGIHGATFSSQQLHEGSPASAVQIGDPITQKRMSDFLLKARDEGLYNSITDNGAGGLSSSVGEMAKESGGAEIDLTNAPLKYAGLHPWEIFLSEAQERMTVAVPPDKLTDFMNLAEKMNVLATPLGNYTDSGVLRVKYKNETVALLHLKFLHEGLPEMKLKAVWDTRHCRVKTNSRITRNPDPAELPSILSRLNVASKEYWVRQYDHEVQGASVVKPLCGPFGDAPSDAAVLMPVEGTGRGLVIACGICPKFSDADTYNMSACAIDEAVRNAICVGADPVRMAALDNFSWTDPIPSEINPLGEFKLAQLVRACHAVKDMAIAYSLPFISGKDSMKNDYKHEGKIFSIPPTLLITVLGIIEDVAKAVTLYPKAPGDLVYIAGITRDELGCSEWANNFSIEAGKVPEVRVRETVPLYHAIHHAMERSLIKSCHDCSDGGLAVALAEKCFSGGMGMEVNLSLVPCEGFEDCGICLFSESAGRFVLTIDPASRDEFERLMDGLPVVCIGMTTFDEKLTIKGKINGHKEGKWQWNIWELKKAWKTPLSF